MGMNLVAKIHDKTCESPREWYFRTRRVEPQFPENASYLHRATRNPANKNSSGDLLPGSARRSNLFKAFNP